MLSEKINEPLPQFEIGLSQPEKQKLKSFIASEPVLTNARAPTSSPVTDENIVSSSPIRAIPDSLPISVIPDTQQQACGSGDERKWQLQSSFDYKSKIEDSDISAGEDTMKDFARNDAVKENENSYNEEMNQPKKATEISLNRSNLASACSTKNSRKTKKPLKFEECEPAGAVILVGTDSKKAALAEKVDETIKIHNNFNKKILSKPIENPNSKKDENIGIEIVNIVRSVEEDVVEIEDPKMEIEINSSGERNLETMASEPISADNSPNLSQELEQINHDINQTIPSSPGDVYKSMLRDGLKESCKSALSAKNSPAQKTLQKSFKRRLMDADENYLCSQNSPESPTPSQTVTKRLPAFARKKELPSLNASSSFVVSKNKSLNQPRKCEKSVPEEVIPLPPARKSILKKKFLVKDAGPAPLTPKLGKFDFDEKSPAKSDASWMKTEKKKKRTAGFKTKKQRLQEERTAKRKMKEEQKKDKPNKVLYLKFHINIGNPIPLRLKSNQHFDIFCPSPPLS